MKLGTLLAAGKSIMKGQVEVSYRASRQVYLPKFGPVRNPFKPETSQPATETSEPAPAAPRVLPRATRVARETTVATPMPHLSSPTQTSPAPPAIAAKKKSHWAGLFNPASIFHGPTAKNGDRPLDKTTTPQKSEATQPELSLDSVKVVHNDLSDVDVEIVPMKSRPGVAEEPAPKKSWEFLSERLLHIEAS